MSMSHHSDFSDPPSAKASAFVEALEALCKQHGIQLTTSSYDGLQVWDLNDQERPIYCAGIEDKTADGAATAAENRARESCAEELEALLIAAAGAERAHTPIEEPTHNDAVGRLLNSSNVR